VFAMAPAFAWNGVPVWHGFVTGSKGDHARKVVGARVRRRTTRPPCSRRSRDGLSGRRHPVSRRQLRVLRRPRRRPPRRSLGFADFSKGATSSSTRLAGLSWRRCRRLVRPRNRPSNSNHTSAHAGSCASMMQPRAQLWSLKGTAAILEAVAWRVTFEDLSQSTESGLSGACKSLILQGRDGRVVYGARLESEFLERHQSTSTHLIA